MRIPYCFLVLVSFVLFFFSAKSQSWQPVGPDDFNEPAFNPSTSTAITMDASGHPYVAYRDGYTSILHVRKFNGSTWEEVGNLGINLGNLSEVSLCLDGTGTPYIGYVDVVSAKPTVKKYDGSSWVDVGTTGAMTGVTFSPDVAMAVTSSGTVYVAFPDLNNSRKLVVKIKFPASDWFDMGVVTTSAVGGVSMTLDGSGNPYFAFSDAGNSGAISVIKFAPGFGLVGPLGFSSGSVNATSIALDASGTTYVAFPDGGNGKKIAVKKFDGTNWVDVGNPGFSIGEAQNVGLKIDGSGNIYVLYCDLGNSNKTMVKRFDGSNWIDAGPEISTLGGNRQRLALDAAGAPYVIYVAANNLFEGKAEVKKLSGGTWATIGTKGIEEDGVRATRIVTNSKGVPYVVYMNYTTRQATVKKYDGNSWVTVGPPGFSVTAVGYTSMAMSSNNIPFVFYVGINGAVVKQFDGSNWVDVGTPGFFAMGMDNISIVISAGGTPYVAYRNLVSGKINVQKYDGSNWVYVGSADFSAGAANYISLAVDASGTPYVNYQDAGNSNMAVVQKFDGSNWVNVGPPGISPGSASRNCLAIDGNGTLYAAYYDGEVSIKKFDGSNWVDVGTVGSGVTNVMTFAVDGNNVPYVAYNILPAIGMAVKKFDGSNWINVGNTSITAGRTSGGSNGLYLTFGAGNVPLISYTNGSMYVKSFGPITILPLQLTAFNGRIYNADALLTWHKDNEINTQTFIVESSTDGRHYSTAGTVPAANTTGNHQYTFIDRNVDQLGASYIYYRLKQIDIDGQATYSRVLILPVDKSAGNIQCYPNPATSEANLTITLGKPEKVQARVLDNMGKVVLVQQWNLEAGSSSLSLNMRPLAKGIYYIAIRSRSLNKQIPVLKQ